MTVYSPLEQFTIVSVIGGINTFIIFLVPIMVYIYVLFDTGLYNQTFSNVFRHKMISFIYKCVYEFRILIYRAGSAFSFLFLFIFLIVFSYILLANILGLTPWGFTLTAHLIIAFFLSLSGFGWLNLLFFLRFPTKFVSIFLPSGTPFAIVFIIIPIEILSYVSRVFSLSIRLFANMMSGHTLLHILSGFIFAALTLNWLFLIPLTIINLIIFVEVGVALLQVYVFITLLNLYVNDTVNPDSH